MHFQAIREGHLARIGDHIVLFQLIATPASVEKIVVDIAQVEMAFLGNAMINVESAAASSQPSLPSQAEHAPKNELISQPWAIAQVRPPRGTMTSDVHGRWVVERFGHYPPSARSRWRARASRIIASSRTGKGTAMFR